MCDIINTSGDAFMTIEEMKKIFETNKEVKFKLYSLEYIIKMINDKVVIYPIIYETRKSVYNTIDELLNNYLIYNETIIANENRINK